MKRGNVLFLLALLCTSTITAQTASERTISIVFDSNVNLSRSSIKDYTIKEIKLDVLKFYVGHFHLYSNNEMLWKDSTYFLIDCIKESGNTITLKVPSDIQFNNIRFNMGVDSVTNISGAMEGDLDPINGMYWAWNTGYINAKIEGKIMRTKGRENDFQFHLGGYQSPFQSYRHVAFSALNDDQFIWTVDIPEFIKNINLNQDSLVMSPSLKSVLISDFFWKSIE